MSSTEIQSAKQRVRQVWQWPSVRRLLLVAAAITVIISLFEIRPSFLAMLQEVVSNFIICVSITFVTSTLMAAFGDVRLGRDWQKLLLLVGLLAVGGMLGGSLSWAVNSLLFPFHISHPWVYLMMVAALAIIFGLAILAYENVAAKLEETASKLAEKEVQEQTLLRLKAQAELDALRARVNPHFLFNTLNSIASLIPADPGKAEDMVQRVSSLFRYILATGERSLVTLGEELDVVTEYLEIEKVRLADRLDYRIDRDEAIEDVQIPGMLLQPLVENSVKHGIAARQSGGHIRVRCQRNGTRCIITIEDDGLGFETPATEGFGLGGVRQRLALHYPGDHEFTISSGDGVRLRIGIPHRT